MQKITPHLWFDREASEAAALYVSLFANSRIRNTNTLSGTPSGDCNLVAFDVAGQALMAISSGTHFKLNPSISLFAVFDNERETDAVWHALADRGKALMPYDAYPWARKYGWLQDRFGLSWQLSWNSSYAADQKLTPLLMFTRDNAGKAKDAIDHYTGVFENSHIEIEVPWITTRASCPPFPKRSGAGG